MAHKRLGLTWWQQILFYVKVAWEILTQKSKSRHLGPASRCCHKSIRGKTVVITGPTSGIGLETAKYALAVVEVNHTTKAMLNPHRMNASSLCASSQGIGSRWILCRAGLPADRRRKEAHARVEVPGTRHNCRGQTLSPRTQYDI